MLLQQPRRPGGDAIALSYDSGGRLRTVTFDAGSISFGYQPTGQIQAITAPGESLAYTFDGPLPLTSTWTGAVAGVVGYDYTNLFTVAAESERHGRRVTGVGSVQEFRTGLRNKGTQFGPEHRSHAAQSEAPSQQTANSSTPSHGSAFPSATWIDTPSSTAARRNSRGNALCRGFSASPPIGPNAYVFGSECGEHQPNIQTAWDALLLLAYGIEPRRSRRAA